MAVRDLIDEKKWDGDGVPLEESNVAEIGSDEDKAARKEAAQTEPAWEGVGEESGLWVWRIENFKVVPWPKEKYGQFHVNDSYIVLHVQEADDRLEREIYFWLGEETSADERGVAAYKTVELDDLFDGGCSQSRQIQGKESESFQALFPSLRYLPGGVESGFDPAQPDIFQVKLLHLKRTKKSGIVIRDVPAEAASLNHRDCFVLDCGHRVYTWYGDETSPFLKYACNARAEEIEGERNGDAEVIKEVDEEFWTALGGEADITAAEDAPDEDVEPNFGEGVLYKVDIDEARQIQVDEVGRGELDRSMLDDGSIMMLDTATELFLWHGPESSALEQRNAMSTAVNYLRTNGRDVNSIAIHVFKNGNGGANKTWGKIFAS